MLAAESADKNGKCTKGLFGLPGGLPNVRLVRFTGAKVQIFDEVRKCSALIITTLPFCEAHF